MSTGATTSNISNVVYDGTKTGWFKFERNLKAKLKTVGAKDIVFAATPQDRRRKIQQQNLPGNASTAAVANFQHQAKQNELFVAQHTKGIEVLYGMITNQLQTDLNDIDDLAEMFDALAIKYKPQLNAENVWSDENVAAIKSLILQPIAPDGLFMAHFNDIVTLHSQLGNRLPEKYYDIIQDLRATLLPQTTTGWTRWIEHLETADKIHKTGADLIKFLQECDDKDHNLMRLGKGPTAPQTKTPTTPAHNATSVVSPNVDPAMMLPIQTRGDQVSHGGRFGGRGVGGRGFFNGRGNRGGRGFYHGGRGGSNNNNHYHPYNNKNGDYAYDHRNHGGGRFRGGRFGRGNSNRDYRSFNNNNYNNNYNNNDNNGNRNQSKLIRELRGKIKQLQQNKDGRDD